MDLLKFPAVDVIEIYAAENKIRIVDAALIKNANMLKKESIWPDTQHQQSISNSAAIDLCSGRSGDLLTDFTRSICNSIQFPESTAFLHGLGVVAGACAKSFKFKYHGSELPLNMYVVTAQPPATGKSGIHKYFFDPVEKAYTEINEANTENQVLLKKQIRKLEKEIDDDDDKLDGLTCGDPEKLKAFNVSLMFIYFL